MMALRAMAVVMVIAAPLVGCSLFSDFGGFSENEPAVSPDAAGGDDGAVDVADAGADTKIIPVEAGPDASAYKLAVLADQPAAYWPFDEDVGANVAKDIVGGKDAEVVGAITFGVPGADGTAVERAASGGGRLDVGDFFDLAGKTAYSIEFWAWPKGDNQFEDVLSKRNGAQVGWWIYFRDAESSIQIEQRYAAGSRTTYAPVPSSKTKLHHLVFVFDPTQASDVRQRVYIDSVRTDGFSDDGDADDNTTPLTFMAGLVGVLDEVAIYDHALSAARIGEHYKLGPK